MPHFGNLIIKPILYLPEVKRSSRVRCVHELFQELSNVLRLDIKVQGNQDFRELVNISKLSTSAGETAQRPVPPLFFSFFFCPPSTNKSAAPTTLSHLENDVEALWSSQIQFDFFSRSHWPLSVIACVKKILDSSQSPSNFKYFDIFTTSEPLFKFQCKYKPDLFRGICKFNSLL